MQCLWLFIVRLSAPYKLFMLCNTARVPRRLTPDPPSLKNGVGVDPPPPPPMTVEFISAHYSMGIHQSSCFSSPRVIRNYLRLYIAPIKAAPHGTEIKVLKVDTVIGVHFNLRELVLFLWGPDHLYNTHQHLNILGRAITVALGIQDGEFAIEEGHYSKISQ